MTDYCDLARRKISLANEAFERGFHATGRIYLNSADRYLAEYNYLRGFIGPRRSESTLAF
jgi:hypothetical protein